MLLVDRKLPTYNNDINFLISGNESFNRNRWIVGIHFDFLIPSPEKLFTISIYFMLRFAVEQIEHD